MRGRGFTAEGLDFCFALRQKGNVVRPKACYNCRSHLTRFCGKRRLCARIFCTVRHCALRCFPPEAQCRAPGSSRQFSLTTYTFLRGGGYAWPEVLRRRVWISALLCGRKETLCARKPVPIAAPVSHAFAGKGYCKHNGNRAVTAFLFLTRFCEKKRLCDRIFCTVWHCTLRCFPPEAQCRAPKSSRQFSLTTYTFLRGGGYAWPGVLRRRVWISALLCGRKETLRARKPVRIAAPISHAFVGKGGCATGFLHCSALCTALLSARSTMPCARKFAAVLLTVPCAFAESATLKGRFTPEICRISLRTFREASSCKGQGYGMSAAAVSCASRRRDFRKDGTF